MGGTEEVGWNREKICGGIEERGGVEQRKEMERNRERWDEI